MTSQGQGQSPIESAGEFAGELADVRLVGRYAPSPTGRLHLGNARTALLSWMSVRARGGRYILRIEDLDKGRCRPEFEVAIFDDLRWLGLDWDEGPRVGGPNGPYRQSECAPYYTAAVAQLDTYPCYCTRREIRDAVSAPHGATPVYPGTCAVPAFGRDASASIPHARPASLRLRCGAGRVEVQDRIVGAFAQDLAREVGDFIVRRADGAYAYQLSVVVDDGRMGVTEVYRGQDLLESTPRQIYLQSCLGLPTPSYAHAPLVLGPDGAKLNKRHMAPDLSRLREAGVDPRSVVASLLASVGMLRDPARNWLSASEAVALYDEDALREAKGDTPLALDPSWPKRP